MRLGDPEVAPLLAGLEQEYTTRYGPNEEMSRAAEHQFEPPQGAFVVLVDGSDTIAGGGFRFHSEGVCEVKRMWTDPAYRRRGLANRILEALEKEAVVRGYGRLVLETGPGQPEAVALYERRGYARIQSFGTYTGSLAFATDL